MPGFAWPLVVYAACLVLHRLLPARTVDGYVTDDAGRPLPYRLNGLAVFVIVVGGFVLAASRGWVAWDVFYVHRWEAAASACVLGLVFTLAIVLPAKPVGSLGADLYLGRLPNPQWLGIDAKMYLYLVGAVMLELNVVSSAAHHVLTYADDPSPGVLLHAVMFSYFLVEYLTFEEVHLYTYDFFAERVGFKLGWGCLVFYPFFYNVGLWSTADRPNPHTPTAFLIVALIAFFGGWMLSRGANLQKFTFKTNPGKKLFGLLRPGTVSDGNRTLLTSGFWGLSRHINYLGEILMALGLAGSLGYPTSPWPWLYPAYYLVLLLPRQHDDDKRCAKKYGALWETYCAKVPSRIIPWIY